MHLLHIIIESLFPLRESEKIIATLNVSHILSQYAPQIHSDGIISLTVFSHPIIRSCIHELKYHKNKKSSGLLTILVATFITEHKQSYTIIPLPLSKQRKRTRGYNQIEIITTLLQKQYPKTIIQTNILRRTRDTVPQTTLTRKERIFNMEDAFACEITGDLSGRHILILDDVTTTGATLRAAKAALLSHHPASITCVALAH